MKKYGLIFFFGIFIFGCNSKKEEVKIPKNEETSIQTFPEPIFTLAEANKLIELPLHCVGTEYPYKPGETLESKADLVEPIVVHPIFYGCFDWHSAVHGYWSMVTLLKQFPEIDRAEEVRKLLKEKITADNVATEVDFFEKPINKSFERTYGWAWLGCRWSCDGCARLISRPQNRKRHLNYGWGDGGSIFSSQLTSPQR